MNDLETLCDQHCGYGILSLSLVTKSFLTLTTPWTAACQAPLSMGFSKQEYWSGLPFPSPGYGTRQMFFI